MMISSAQRIRLPWWLRALNRVGRWMAAVGWSPLGLEPQLLMEQLTQETGLSDFGDEDFLEPMELLLRSTRDEARLSFSGQIGLREELLRVLRNRLLIQRALQQQPAILQEEIPAPLLVIGLPRTGTTFLHNMLSQDPHARVPRMWEFVSPAPFPDDPDDRKRIATTEAMVQNADRIPHLRSAHPMNAHWPDECFWLFTHSFQSIAYDARYHLPSYRSWFVQAGWEKRCREYKQQLQLLQSQQPRKQHWILKAPSHLFRLKELLEVFPDARIIHTHRSPYKTAPSCCSLYEIARVIASDHVDLHQLGDDWLTSWACGVERFTEAREALPQERFFDVAFSELMADPFAVVKQIYGHFGMAYSPQMQAGMEGWLAQNPRHKHGKHRYTLERYGLTEARIREALPGYFERFGREFFAVDADG